GGAGSGTCCRSGTWCHHRALALPARMENIPRLSSTAVETENAKPTEGTTTSPDTRAAMDTIVREELALLTKVQRHLAVHRPSRPPPIEDYEEQLISLRDQIASS